MMRWGPSRYVRRFLYSSVAKQSADDVDNGDILMKTDSPNSNTGSKRTRLS